MEMQTNDFTGATIGQRIAVRVGTCGVLSPLRLAEKSVACRTNSCFKSNSMLTVQPFPMRSQVSEASGDLLISIPPKRGWVVLFFMVWLTFWTYAGIQTGQNLIKHFSLFSSIWMVGWAFGELWASYAILYSLAGRETILANSETLTRTTKILGVGWSKGILCPRDEGPALSARDRFGQEPTGQQKCVRLWRKDDQFRPGCRGGGGFGIDQANQTAQQHRADAVTARIRNQLLATAIGQVTLSPVIK